MAVFPENIHVTDKAFLKMCFIVFKYLALPKIKLRNSRGCTTRWKYQLVTDIVPRSITPCVNRQSC